MNILVYLCFILTLCLFEGIVNVSPDKTESRKMYQRRPSKMEVALQRIDDTFLDIILIPLKIIMYTPFLLAMAAAG